MDRHTSSEAELTRFCKKEFSTCKKIREVESIEGVRKHTQGRFLHEVKGVDYYDIDKLLSDEEKMTKNFSKGISRKRLIGGEE